MLTFNKELAVRNKEVYRLYCLSVGDPAPTEQPEEGEGDGEGEGEIKLIKKKCVKKRKGKEKGKGKKKDNFKELNDLIEIEDEEEEEQDGKSIRHSYPIAEEDKEWVEERLKEDPTFVYRPQIIDNSDTEEESDNSGDSESEVVLKKYLKKAKYVKSGFRFRNNEGRLRLMCPVIECGENFGHTQTVNTHIKTHHPQFQDDYIDKGKVTYSASHIGTVNRYLKILKEYLVEGKMPPPEVIVERDKNGNIVKPAEKIEAPVRFIDGEDKKFVEKYMNDDNSDPPEKDIVDIESTISANEIKALDIQRIATIQDIDTFNGDKNRWWEANFYNTEQADWERLVDVRDFVEEEINEDGDEYILEENFQPDPEIDNDENLIVCGGLVVDLGSYKDYNYDSVSDAAFECNQKKKIRK